MKRAHPRPVRIALAALALAVVAAWVVLLRPQFLGGPAAYVIVSGTSMEPTLVDGDLVLARKESSYAAGDIVAFRVPKGDPGAGAMVIHRVVGGSASAGYRTKGDNRSDRDTWRPTSRDIVGSLWLTIPRAGAAVAFLRSPFVLAGLAGLAAFLFVSAGRRQRRPKRAPHGLRGSYAYPRPTDSPPPRRRAPARFSPGATGSAPGFRATSPVASPTARSS
jgi:signal peptidase I